MISNSVKIKDSGYEYDSCVSSFLSGTAEKKAVTIAIKTTADNEQSLANFRNGSFNFTASFLREC